MDTCKSNLQPEIEKHTSYVQNNLAQETKQQIYPNLLDIHDLEHKVYRVNGKLKIAGCPHLGINDFSSYYVLPKQNNEFNRLMQSAGNNVTNLFGHTQNS